MTHSDIRYTNRLIHESSPYLLQHAHNPVNWLPWSNEAFDIARTENKPVILSIGYSACHWCHVMERESFENEEVAEFMNQHFVCIKVDREERPDVDNIYMNAVQAMSGTGGWPLNVFLTPDREPFMGGTYFPPKPYSNMPSWSQVLEFIDETWIKDREKVIRQANYLTEFLKEEPILDKIAPRLNGSSSDNSFTRETIDNIYQSILPHLDKQNGGFGPAPKFLNTFSHQFLLKYYFFTGNKDALHHVDTSLRKMCSGGLYDHVGGGFARYSTDTHWFAPHFEKMLYDNVLMIDLLCNTYQLTDNELYKDVVEKTLQFIEREMMSEEGGFYSAIDADSEGKEGQYYVWSKAEIDRILGPDSALFCDYYAVTEEGNWEKSNILYHDGNLENIARKYKVCGSELQKKIDFALQKLFVDRNNRIAPQIDDKIVLSWNALTISAFVKAYKAFSNDQYLSIAKKSLSFLLEKLAKVSEAGFHHNYKNGKAYNEALLDDYALLIMALLDMYEITFDTSFIDKADKLAQYVIDNFRDQSDGLFFLSPAHLTDLIARKKDLNDGVTPSGNSVMVLNLNKLSTITGNNQYKTIAEDNLDKMLVIVEEYPLSFSNFATEVFCMVYSLPEIAILGKSYKESALKLYSGYNPGYIIMASLTENNKFPLLNSRGIASKDLYYICKDKTCLQPYESYDEFLTQLSSIEKDFKQR